PDVLSGNANYALGLLFHPRLPLLYVWQDIKAPPADKQENHPEFADYLEFDHLLIYEVKDGALELLQSARQSRWPLAAAATRSRPHERSGTDECCPAKPGKSRAVSDVRLRSSDPPNQAD